MGVGGELEGSVIAQDVSLDGEFLQNGEVGAVLGVDALRNRFSHKVNGLLKT